MGPMPSLLYLIAVEAKAASFPPAISQTLPREFKLFFVHLFTSIQLKLHDPPSSSKNWKPNNHLCWILTMALCKSPPSCHFAIMHLAMVYFLSLSLNGNSEQTLLLYLFWIIFETLFYCHWKILWPREQYVSTSKLIIAAVLQRYIVPSHISIDFRLTKIGHFSWLMKKKPGPFSVQTYVQKSQSLIYTFNPFVLISLAVVCLISQTHILMFPSHCELIRICQTFLWEKCILGL